MTLDRAPAFEGAVFLQYGLAGGMPAVAMVNSRPQHARYGSVKSSSLQFSEAGWRELSFMLSGAATSLTLELAGEKLAVNP